MLGGGCEECKRLGSLGDGCGISARGRQISHRFLIRDNRWLVCSLSARGSGDKDGLGGGKEKARKTETRCRRGERSSACRCVMAGNTTGLCAVLVPFLPTRGPG